MIDLTASIALCVISVSALIEKIYNAQKEREECINDRLKRVTEEKEELMKKVKRLQNEPG